jgi:hypothetical protein
LLRPTCGVFSSDIDVIESGKNLEWEVVRRGSITVGRCGANKCRGRVLPLVGDERAVLMIYWAGGHETWWAAAVDPRQAQVRPCLAQTGRR